MISRRDLYAFGEPFGNSSTRKKLFGRVYGGGGDGDGGGGDSGSTGTGLNPGKSQAGGWSTGLGNTGLGPGNTSGATGPGLGVGPGNSSNGYGLGGLGSTSPGLGSTGVGVGTGSNFGYGFGDSSDTSAPGGPSAGFSGYGLSDSFSPDYGLSLADAFSTPSPTSYSLTSMTPTAQEAMSQMAKEDVSETAWEKLKKNPVAQVAMTVASIANPAIGLALGLTDAAANKDYGRLAAGIAGVAGVPGIGQAAIGIGTNAALGKNVAGQLGSTMGGMVGSNIGAGFGPLGAQVGGRVGSAVGGKAASGGFGTSGSTGGFGGTGNGGGMGFVENPQQASLDWGQLAAGLGGMYMANRQAGDAGAAASGIQSGVNQQLSDMFGPNSAYAQQLRKELERKDAASGRRSQYGAREVELQAKLAQMQAQYAPSLMNSMVGQQQAALLAEQQRRAKQQMMFNTAMKLGQSTGLFDSLGNMFSGNSGSTYALTNSSSYYNDGGGLYDLYSGGPNYGLSPTADSGLGLSANIGDWTW